MEEEAGNARVEAAVIEMWRRWKLLWKEVVMRAAEVEERWKKMLVKEVPLRAILTDLFYGDYDDYDDDEEFDAAMQIKMTEVIAIVVSDFQRRDFSIPIDTETTPSCEATIPVDERVTPFYKETTPIFDEATPISEEAMPINAVLFSRRRNLSFCDYE